MLVAPKKRLMKRKITSNSEREFEVVVSPFEKRFFLEECELCDFSNRTYLFLRVIIYKISLLVWRNIVHNVAIIDQLNPKHLSLILLPTEDCNFRCTYCYEDFAIGRMEEWTVKAIKLLIDKRIKNLQTLELSWFGGEPLLAKDIVTGITAYAQRAAASMNVSFWSVMTTNGFTLNHSTFDALLKLDIRSYQISLDGDADEHNKTRKLVSSRGSFSKIWLNLLAMRASTERFNILIRVHLHGSNFESAKILLKRINDVFGTDTRFNILLKSVGNWGGESVKAMNLLKSPGQTIYELDDYLGDLGWYLNRRIESKDSFIQACYAALPNSFVIRADGSLAKCTVAFNDPRNRVGKINEDGTLSMENKLMQNFMRGLESLKESELHCPMKDMPFKEQVIQVHQKPVAALTAN